MPLTSKSNFLKIAKKLYGGLLRPNTRLWYSDHLPGETKFPIILPKNHIFTKLIVKYHHKTEGTSRDGSELYIESFARKVPCCSRTASEGMYHGMWGMEQAIQAPFPRITLEMTCRPFANRSLSIYQYSNMAPRLSGQTFICGVVFFVSFENWWTKET